MVQIIILILFVIVLIGANFYFFSKITSQYGQNNAKDNNQDSLFKLMLEQLNEVSRTVDKKMGDMNKLMHESTRTQFTESKRLIQEIHEQVGKNLLDVTKGLTSLHETNKQVISFSEQLQSLQDILKNPKQRGVLGEYYLETLLKNVLPPGSYQMQYKLNDQDIVDAVVFVKDKIIPIDSKFSLENYNRLIEAKDPSEKSRLEKLFVNDLKLRIQETSKYIQPERNTTDFAFMFIPHEAIYYDLLINKIGGGTNVDGDEENLIQKAAGKYHVLIISPTSFLAYLQTVLQGLRMLKIEETAKDIVKRVSELSKHLISYQDYHSKLGNALSTAVNQYNFSGKEFKKIDKDIVRITGEAVGIEPMMLEKPDSE